MPGFLLLVRPRGDADTAIGIGYTVTRKIGGAVVRNRMKRRFRALARALLSEHGTQGADHVLIGRGGGIERDFGVLEAELRKALVKAGTLPGGGRDPAPASAARPGLRRGRGKKRAP